MLILIEKDSATRIPKEVATVEQAQAFAAEFVVYVVDDSAGTVLLADWIAAQEPQVGEQVISDLPDGDSEQLSTVDQAPSATADGDQPETDTQEQ